ncbi:MAG: NUDIX hydrolase [Desulfobacterales bacterium]|nr:NUDIX hydrolase [Desulfobacterales bacterium]
MTAVINRSVSLYKGQVFDLVKENYTLDNGVTSEMDFIQHPGAAAMVAMLNSTDVILIKQYRHALREFIWEIPAGTLDPKESPLRCAKRELIEETGYSAAKWQQLGTITPLPGCSDERIHIFLASDLRPAEQNLDDDEMLNVHPLKLEKALQMILTGDISDGKTISGLYLAYNWLKQNHPDIYGY